MDMTYLRITALVSCAALALALGVTAFALPSDSIDGLYEPTAITAGVTSVPDLTIESAEPEFDELPDLAAAPIRLLESNLHDESDVVPAADTTRGPRRPPLPPSCGATVVFVDAVTGLEILGCKPREGAVPSDERTENHGVAGWGYVDGGDEGLHDGTRHPLFRASMSDRLFNFEAPYFAWMSTQSAKVSDRATSFRTVRPLHRELNVRLRLMEFDGAVSRDAVLEYWSVAGSSNSRPRWESEGGGRGRLRDVPWIPGAKIELAFRSKPTQPESVREGESAEVAPIDATGTPPGGDVKIFVTTIPMPLSSDERIERDVVLAWTTTKSDGLIGLGRGAGGAFGRGHRCGSRSISAKTYGSARARFLDVRGHPIPRLRVRIAGASALTNSDGIACVKNVCVGSKPVLTEDSGYRFETATIEVVSDNEASIEIVEQPAQTVEVFVVDEQGRSVASASIELKSERFDWFDVDENGVQRLDPFTDVWGRRACHGVPCGKATVRAHFGGSRGEGTVEVGESGPSVVRITVK